MAQSQPILNEDNVGHILKFLPLNSLFRFHLCDKFWYQHALDREERVCTVLPSEAVRLSRLRPRGIALGLPSHKSKEDYNSIITAFCSLLEKATSVEVTAPSREPEIGLEAYNKLCSAMVNVTELVLRSRDLTEETSFSFFPNLRRLSLSIESDLLDEVLENIVSNCPCLEFLHVYLDTSSIGTIRSFVEALSPLKRFKELIIDDPHRDIHVLELLTGRTDKIHDKTILASLENLQRACPESLKVSNIFVVSLGAKVRYEGAESIPILLLPFIPEPLLAGFLTNYVDANAKSSWKSSHPVIAALFSSHHAPIKPLRTDLECVDVLLGAGVDIFSLGEVAGTIRSAFHNLVQLHAIQGLVHLMKYVLSRHPTRVAELLWDSHGYSVLHYLNIFPSVYFSTVVTLVEIFKPAVEDLSLLLNDSNNVEHATAVTRFVRASCSLLPEIRKKSRRLVFKEILCAIGYFRSLGCELSSVDASGHSCLSLLLAAAPHRDINLVLERFPFEKEIQKSLSKAPASWADAVLNSFSTPEKEGPFVTAWKCVIERSSIVGRRVAFQTLLLSEAGTDALVWSLVSRIIALGYDPGSLIQDKQPWIALSKDTFPSRVLLFADKLGWDLGSSDPRGLSLLSASTNHPTTIYDDNYANKAKNIFSRMRDRPQNEQTHYARALGLSAFAGNLAYTMLSEEQETIDSFVSVTKTMASSLVEDFYTLGDQVLSSARVCWLTVEQILYVGVAASIGFEKAADLLQALATRVDSESCLGNSSVLMSAVTHCCLATDPKDIEWYTTAFTILLSDRWKQHRYDSKRSDRESFVLLYTLLNHRWTKNRAPIVKLLIDDMDPKQTPLASVLFSQLFDRCDKEVGLHFASSTLIKSRPELLPQLLCSFIRKPADFNVAHAILDQHPTFFASNTFAADLVLRNFCYSLDVIHSGDSDDHTDAAAVQDCVGLLSRLIELGVRSLAPFDEDYKRQFKANAHPEIVALFEKMRTQPPSHAMSLPNNNTTQT